LLSVAKWYYPPDLDWTRAAFSRVLPLTVGVQALYSALFLLAAMSGLRPLRLGQWGRRGCQGAASRCRRPVLGENPMLWKERDAPGPLPRQTVLLFLLLSVGLLLPLAAPAWDAFQEWRQEWQQGLSPLDKYDGTVWARGYLNHVVRQIGAVLYLFVLAVVAATAAISVTGERERGTWSSLAATLVSGSEVVRAKAAGAVWAARAWSMPLLVLWVLGLATGAVHPVGVLAAAIAILIFARFAAALGVFYSMISRSSERALLATFLTLLAGNVVALLFVPLDLIGPLAGSRQAVYLACLTPLVEWVALVSPVEIHSWLEGRVWEGRLQLPAGLWSANIALGPGLVATYLASLVLHAAAAAALLRAAAWSFARSGRS
jgi:hypothetical protein